MWAEDKKKYVKFSTFSAYEVILTHHILPEFSGRTMLSEDDVQEFVLNKLRGGLSPKTVKDILMVLRMVAGFGERNGVLPGLGLPFPVTLVIGNEKYIIFGKMEYIRISNNDASFSVTMVHRFR